MINNLNNLLVQLESKIPHFEKTNLQISKSNVGWHIEHTLLTINGIIYILPQSIPKDYKWKFNFIRSLVLTLKKIPRGRAKSPKVVQPKENYNIESLTIHLLKAREKIKELQALNKGHYFEHPFFGNLRLKQTINFLEIHTKHHLEIINDIIK